MKLFKYPYCQFIVYFGSYTIFNSSWSSVFFLFFVFFQALRSQWEKDAETTQSNLQTSLSETQNSLTATQAELANTQASLTKTNEALTEAQAALSELHESQARLVELQTSAKEQNQKLEEELRQAFADRDAAACELHTLTKTEHSSKFIILVMISF